MNARRSVQLQVAVNLAVWTVAIFGPWVLVIAVARWMT